MCNIDWYFIYFCNLKEPETIILTFSQIARKKKSISAELIYVCKSVHQPRGTCHSGFLKSDPAEVLPGHCINLTSLIPAMSHGWNIAITYK